jgi:chromosome segregation ATPase
MYADKELLASKLSTSESELRLKVEECVNLSKQLEDQEESAKRQQDNVASLKEIYENRIMEMNAAAKQEEEEYEYEIEAMSNELAQLREALDVAERNRIAEEEKLKMRFADMLNDAEELEEGNSRLLEETERLTQINADLTNQCDQLNIEINSLQTELDSKNDSLLAAEKKIAVLVSESSNLADSLNTLKVAYAADSDNRFSELVESSRQEIETCHVQIKTLTESLEAAKEQNKTQKDKMTSSDNQLQSRLADALQEMEDMEGDIALLQEENETLKETIANKTGQCESLLAEQIEKENTIRQLRSAISSLEEKITQYVDSENNLKLEISALKDNIKAKDHEMLMLSEHTFEVEEELYELKAKLNVETSNSNVENEELKQKIKSLEENLLKKDKVVNEIDNARMEDKHLIDTQTQLLENQRQEISNLEKEKSMLKTEIDNNVELINRLQSQNQEEVVANPRYDEVLELTSKVNSLESKLSDVIAEKETLQEKVLLLEKQSIQQHSNNDNDKQLLFLSEENSEIKLILEEQNKFLSDAAYSLDASEAEIAKLKNELKIVNAELHDTKLKIVNTPSKLRTNEVNETKVEATSAYVYQMPSSWTYRITALEQELLSLSEQLVTEKSQKKDIRKLLSLSLKTNSDLIMKDCAYDGKDATDSSVHARWMALNSIPVYVGYDFLYRVDGMSSTINDREQSVVTKAIDGGSIPVESTTSLEASLSAGIDHLKSGWSIYKVYYYNTCEILYYTIYKI